MIRIAICRAAQVREDWVTQSLEKVIGTGSEFESFWSAKDLKQYVNHYGYIFNAYFFDNKVPGIDFVELATSIRKKDPTAFSIFIDFEIPNAEIIGELIPCYSFNRPFDLQFLKVAYKWVLHYQDSTKNDFSFRFRRKAYRFLKEEILYFEQDGRYAFLHTTDGRKQKMITTRNEIMNLVNPDLFVEIDVSYIVNLMYVKSIGKDTLQLSNGEILNIARRKRKNLLQKVELVDRFLH